MEKLANTTGYVLGMAGDRECLCSYLGKKIGLGNRSNTLLKIIEKFPLIILIICV